MARLRLRLGLALGFLPWTKSEITTVWKAEGDQQKEASTSDGFTKASFGFLTTDISIRTVDETPL